MGDQDDSHNAQTNGTDSTSTFVRDVKEDRSTTESGNVDPHDHGDSSENNGYQDPYSFTGTDTSVRDVAGFDSLSNNGTVSDGFQSQTPKRYSLSADAQPFIPSGASKTVFDAILSHTTNGATPDVSDLGMSNSVSGHLRKITDAKDDIRASLKTLIDVQPVSHPVPGQAGESDAPLLRKQDQGDNEAEMTSLDRKLHAIPPENEGIPEEDCPASYAVPEKEQVEPSETAVRNTDATTTSHKAEEIIAEIHDTSADLPEWMDILGNGSLMKKIVKKGTPGTRPTRASIVTIRTSAEVLNCDLDIEAIFKVVDKHDELKFTVSDLEVIQGLEFAVQLMDIGEIAEVKMLPKYAYGEMGQIESGIPSDATLLYSVELLKVEPPQEIGNVPLLERVSIANHKVDRGNFWYKRKEPMLALSLYQRAVSILEAPCEFYHSPEDSAQVNAAKARAYGNLSSAQVEEKVWDEGLRSVNNALRYDPNNGKLWIRKIKIFREKGQIEEAVNACEDILQKGSLLADHFLQKARDELSSLKKKKRQADDKEKAMYQRMMGSQSKLSGGSTRASPEPDEVSQPRTEYTNPNRKWMFFGAAAAVAIFGAVVGLRYYQAHR